VTRRIVTMVMVALVATGVSALSASAGSSNNPKADIQEGRSSLHDTSRLRAFCLIGPVRPLPVRVGPIVRSSFGWSVLAGMGCPAPSRRYLGDVAFWRKRDNRAGVGLRFNVRGKGVGPDISAHAGRSRVSCGLNESRRRPESRLPGCDR
jgi:hypothetical protein